MGNVDIDRIATQVSGLIRLGSELLACLRGRYEPPIHVQRPCTTFRELTP